MINHNLMKTYISENKEELLRLIQKLIQIRSYSGEEKEIVEFILFVMKKYDFDEYYSDKLGNAVGRIGSGRLKILYDAHIDTVRVTESESWQYPPFEGHISGGKIYGRGAVDEKPAMAGYLMAAKLLKKMFAEKKLPFTLYVVGSVQEEDFDGYPLYHIIQNEKIKPDYVLLGEPTDLKVYRGQRGRMELNITTRGKSAHGAHNQQGTNAIYKMTNIIKEIEKLDENLPSVPPLGKGSLTVSQIISRGPSMCSVPDFCQLHIDRRLTAGETRESAEQELNQIIHNFDSDASVSLVKYNGKSWKGTCFEQDAFFPTWIFDQSHPLVTAGLETATDVLGTKAEHGTWCFSTNGVASAGHFEIPTIGFAPGREELAHSSQEYIHLEDLVRATLFYTLLPFKLALIR